MAAKSKKGKSTLVKDKNNFIILLVIVALITLGIYYVISGMTSSMRSAYTTTKTPTTNQVVVGDKLRVSRTVVLNEQNNSGEYGNAILMEDNGKTVVRVEVKGAPRGVSQPAHLHTGSCIGLGNVVYPLRNVVNGVSETTLDISIDELATKLPLAINIHKSASQSKVYVSCGNLELM